MSKHIKLSMAALGLMAARQPTGVASVVFNEANDEALLREVTAQLERITGAVKSTAETAMSEAKKAGEVSAATKSTADQLLSAQNTLNETVKALEKRLEGIDAQTLEIAQNVSGGRTAASARLTLGQAVLAQQERINAFTAAGARGNLAISVANAITTGNGAAGLIAADEDLNPVNQPRRRLLLRSLISQGRTGSDLIKFSKQTIRDIKAKMVAEGAASDASNFVWEKASEQVKKISHHAHASEEALADADQLRTLLDLEMRYGLDLEEDKQILAGDGVGENLTGLLTVAPSFVAAAGLPNQTRLDRLRLGILQIVLEDYIPSAFLLNPVDWAAIDLFKDANAKYLTGGPLGETLPRLWGKDVVETNTMSGGEWMAGDFEMAATLYDRSEAEILISSEHGTNFIEGMLTVKGTKRLALAHKRPLALVKGDFVFS